VDIDAKDGSGQYIYPRANNRALRPAYEPKNEQKQTIYNQPYPLYNFCVGFYYRLPAGENELGILTGIETVRPSGNRLQVVQAGKMLRIITPSPRATHVRIYDVSGKLLQDFGRQPKNEYSLAALSQGIYIVSAKTASDSVNRKIRL
jgi:hypothetical protein